MALKKPPCMEHGKYGGYTTNYSVCLYSAKHPETAAAARPSTAPLSPLLTFRLRCPTAGGRSRCHFSTLLPTDPPTDRRRKGINFRYRTFYARSLSSSAVCKVIFSDLWRQLPRTSPPVLPRHANPANKSPFNIPEPSSDGEIFKV